jgi:hypothetical protein
MTERWLWTQKQDVGPSPRMRPEMVYDAARKRVVLFGGSNLLGNLNDTWEWDGRAWAEVADTGPSGRTSFGMVYDDARQRIVLFGGSSGSGSLGDTWEWDGEDWTQVADIGPAPRQAFAMAYDKVRQHAVLFSGSGAADLFNDTWAWDGTDWTQIADTGPPARGLSSMAFDSSREVLVLFGGVEGGTSADPTRIVVNDTWEWGEDDTGWVKVQDIGPRDFFMPKMVYTGKHTVLYGSPEPAGRGQTWEWDGRVWTQRQNMGPIARDGPALAYDSQRDRVVLFGGLNRDGGVPTHLGDTWELAIVEPPPA